MSDATSDIGALAVARELIRCRSVTPADDGALDYLQSVLEGLGFACTRLPFEDRDTPPIDNLYARLGTGAPHLCFAGHTDVVPAGDEAAWQAAPFAGEVRDGRLYGRGAADMKGGIAAFTEAVARHLSAREGGPPGSISLLITGDEEGPAINGTAKMLDWAAARGERIDHCLVGEPTNPAALGDMIKIGRRGSLSGTIRVTGRQGHVAYPDAASNPIDGLIRLAAHLQTIELDRGTEAFQPSNLEIISLDVGNEAWNVIPAEARARFNVRFNTEWTADRLKSFLNRELAQAAGSDIVFELTFEPAHSDAFLTDAGELTDVLAGAIKQVTGRVPERSTSGGTSDARFIKDHCPVVEFGLVGDSMHQTDESIALADLEKLTEIYRAFLDAYFSRFAGPQ